MLCKEIHEQKEGCSQSIPDGAQWKFCPRCGSPTGHLQTPECRLTVPRNRPCSRSVTLRNTGLSSVRVDVKAESLVEGFRLSNGTRRTQSIPPGAAHTVSMDIPPISQRTQVGRLCIEVDDRPSWSGSHGADTGNSLRKFEQQVLCDIQKPGELRVTQQCLIFHDDVRTREIDVHNVGDTPLDINGIVCPPGYVCSTGHAVLKPGEKLAIEVSREPNAPADASAELSIRTSDNNEHKVRLYSEEPEQVREVAAAIVGVDFGTTYTSVAFRECRHSDVLDDDVIYLRPLGEENDRFPTRVWVGKSKQLAFSAEATDRYKDDPDEGYLFREVKTLLREPDAVNIHPESERQKAIDFCRDWFGDAWQERLVTEYLSWLMRAVIEPELHRRFGGVDATVQYVFTIPVLDYATDQTLYREQREKMERCVRGAGFPDKHVEFHFEPVSAALGLLHPVRNAENLPRLGDAEHPITNGARIAVFDSGGGTTDVVLAEAEVDGEGNIRLDVKSCLGVGSKAETFGGELVTTNIIRAITNPESVPVARSEWSSGSLHIDNLFYRRPAEDVEDTNDFLETDHADDLEVRDKVDEVKAVLSSSDDAQFEGANQMVLFPRIFPSLLKHELLSLEAELNNRVFCDAERSKTEYYYVCVGGNTCVRYISRWVAGFMGSQPSGHDKRRLDIPEMQKKLAVAYGAVWIPDARIKNAFPYDVIIRNGHGHEIAAFYRNSPQEVSTKEKQYELPAGANLAVTVYAQLDQQEHRVADYTVRNPYERTALAFLRVAVEREQIRVEHVVRDTTANDPVQEYTPIIVYRL